DHEDDLVQGIILMRKGENPDAVIDGVKKKLVEVKRMLPAGVELYDYYSRDRLVKTTVTTVLRNLVEGAALVVVLLSLFLYDLRMREGRRAAVAVPRPRASAVVFTMTVYVPILTCQRIEGRLFRPMAVTISVAVAAALLLTTATEIVTAIGRKSLPSIRWKVR